MQAKCPRINDPVMDLAEGAAALKVQSQLVLPILSMAWKQFSLLFGMSCRRLQQAIPCYSLGDFITVNN